MCIQYYLCTSINPVYKKYITRHRLSSHNLNILNKEGTEIKIEIIENAHYENSMLNPLNDWSLNFNFMAVTNYVEMICECKFFAFV